MTLVDGVRARRSRRPFARRSWQGELLEARVVLASGPLISEFQAINSTTVRDVDGEYSDWIEISNPTATPVDLSGWYLTDDANDLARWQFPDVALAAGGYLLVFASSKDRAAVGGELHTNFRLAAEGEYLALVEPDATTVASEFAPHYPAQVPDHSYGLYLDQPVFFAHPTPGQPNELPTAPAPTISLRGGTFTGTQEVTLAFSSPQPGLEIRYTLDGAAPTASSALYSGPISFSASTWLQARTFDARANPIFEASQTISETYVAIAASLQDTTSDLPLMVIETQGKAIPGTGSTSLASALITLIDVDPQTGRAALLGDTVNYNGRGGLRDRGSSTGDQPKQSYAFETWRQTRDDANVSLLGMPAESDWVMFAPYNFDRALIRNPLIYSLSNQIGRYAPRTRFVEVYLNDGAGSVSSSDYVGVYVLMEKIKRDEDRVDIVPIERTDNTLPAVTGGYLFKIDRSDPGASTFNAAGQTINWVQPESNEVSSAQRTWVTQYFNDFANALNGPNFADPVNGYAKYIDVDSWIDHHLLNVLALNVDALRLSTYFYKDRDGKLEFGPIWDFDRSMESTDGRDDNPNRWRGGGDGTDYFNYPWWGRLFDDANFWQQYVDRWHELRRGALSDQNIDDLIDSLAGQVRESQARNFARWSNVSPRFGGWQGEVDNLRRWLHERTAFIDAQFAANPTFLVDGQPLPTDRSGVAVPVDQPVVVTPPPREVYTDSVIISGNPGDTTGRYLVPTNDSLGTRWTAVAFDDTAWSSGPTGVGYENSAADYASLLRTSIRPQDANGNATTFYARIPFQVSDPTAIDRLVLRMKYDDGFVAYLNGVEVARQNFNGTPAWNSTASNHDDGSAVVYEDFDVSRAVASLRVGANVLAVHAINTGTSSSDMLMLPELVSRSVEFLPGGSGTIYYTTDGSDPRLAGGAVSAAAKVLPTGTPLVIRENVRVVARNLDPANRGPEAQIVGTDWSAPLQFDFVVAAPQLVISEINYNPYPPTASEQTALPGVRSDDFEFLEIRNTGSTPTPLSGVRFADGVGFDFTASKITRLDPGQYALIVKNEQAFAQRYGVGLPVAGRYVGSLDNDREDLDLVDGVGNVLFTVKYDDADRWSERADGVGGTLELVSPFGTESARQSKYYSWRGSSRFGGTPGFDSVASWGVVINEVLAHTDPPITLADSIELYNPTSAAVDVSGWYLSDAASNLRKFRIPDATILAAGAYRVFDEADFNPNPLNPGLGDFSLSGAKGDDVWLTVFDAQGQLVTFVDDVHFPATANGESFARQPNGTGRLTPALHNSFGAANTASRVGPLVISELSYHPGEPSPAALALDADLTASDLEFVEIHNPTAGTVVLTEWRLRGGVDFDFAAGSLLKSGATLVVVPFDPEQPENAARAQAFRAHYGIDPNTRLVGGFQGQLNNADDAVRLQRPDEPPQEDPTFYPRLLEDEVLYDDLSPWPTGADGSGLSLQRTGAHALGNDPASWQAKSATPGAVDFTGAVIGDFDGDRRVDQLDIAMLCRQMQAASDLRFDLSGDGLVDFDDVSFLVKTVLQTSFGDANLDGIFNSADVIEVFVAGQYEDAVVGNATWDSGDWDCDGEFNSSDLILAFSDGGYLAGAQPVPPRVTPMLASALSLPVSSGPSSVRASADRDGHSTSATVVPRTVQRQAAAQVFADADAIADLVPAPKRLWDDVASELHRVLNEDEVEGWAAHRNFWGHEPR